MYKSIKNILIKIALILKKCFYSEDVLKKKHQAINKLSGIITGLPKANYASTIDSVIY